MNSLEMNSLEKLYAYFRDFEDIRDELMESLDSWDTPTIVAFGAQNAGKSTLLERLAMIPLFPKGEGLCTRLAIRIRMRTDENEKTTIHTIKVDHLENQYPKESILSTSIISLSQGDSSKTISHIIHEMMIQLLGEINSRKQGIRSDRLIEVELRRSNLPNLDLLDIPGMVVNPGPNDDPDLPQKTYQLVMNTLKSLKDRAIFLAVREAGEDPQQSLTVKLLNEMPEIKNHCFGILTKCDLISDKLIEDRLQRSKDWQLGYGYFAVVNDPQYSNLIEMALYEKRYFQEEALRRNWVNHQQAGCEIILEKLKDAYHQYLKETWAYDTISRLTKKIQQLEVQLQNFGPIFKDDQTIDPSDEEKLAFTKSIEDSLMIIKQKSLIDIFPIIYTRINEQLNAVENIFSSHDFKQEKILFSTLQIHFFKSMALQNHPIEQINQILRITLSLLFDDYLKMVIEALKADLFGINMISDLRIGRFENIIELILSKLSVEESKKELWLQCEKEIDQWFVDHVQYDQQKVQVGGILRLFEKVINRSILSFQKIDWHFDWYTLLSHQPKLWEDTTKIQRQNIKSYRNKVLITKNKMRDFFPNPTRTIAIDRIDSSN